MMLTAKEREILRHVVAGLMNKQIADREGITLPTVKTHLHNIAIKTKCRSRTQMAVYAMREGIAA